MLGFLYFVIFILVLVLLVKLVIYPYFYVADPFFDDEVEEVVTTTTTTTVVNEQPAYEIVGHVSRYRELTTGQFYCFDPVDGQKYFLNEGDDLFQDAEGKVWQVRDYIA